MIAATPSDGAKIAAEELQRYVEEISGARLEILGDDAKLPKGETIVAVGASRLTKGVDVPVGRTPALREEGFVLEVRGRERVVAVGNDTPPYLGTRYAVVELLRRLGVRWFMPGAFGESVPHAADLALPGDLHVVGRPDFALRGYWQHGDAAMQAENAEWMVHVFMNPGTEPFVGVPGDGSIGNYLPKDQFDAHPEWFALGADGKRRRDMVCMTSTGMIAAFVARVDAEAASGKRVSSFAPADGFPRCEDPGCRALATGFDGFGANDRDPRPEASTSNEWFHFVGAVADGVWKDHPEHLIATNGYANRDIPPELPHFDEHHNLVVMFANIAACTLHRYDDDGCWQMKRQGEMVRRWCRICDKVWLYGYDYTMLVGKFTETPMVHRLRANIPLLHQWGLMGFHDQDEADWSISGIPTRLVRAALEWDVHADVDAILADYYARWFGPAAAPMKDYDDALEAAFDATRVHGHEDVVLDAVYTPALMARLDDDLAHAQALAAGDDGVAPHLEVARRMHAVLHDFVDLQAARRELRFDDAAAAARRILDEQKAMHAISPFLGYEPYAVYGPDWEAARMRALAAKVDGTAGTLVAALPEDARVRVDPHDDGIFERWQEPAFDDRDWKTIRTTAGWDGQGFEDEQGHSYRGLLWYRLPVDVPASAAGKKIVLTAPMVDDEAWLWVNGRYCGHRAWQSPWSRPQTMELDVSQAIEPGRTNSVVLRVLANVDVFGASGVWERMFLWARRP